MQTFDLEKLREQLNTLRMDRSKVAVEKEMFLFEDITEIPHSHDLTRLDMAVFGVCQEGEGVFEIDTRRFVYKRDSYIVLLPNQVVHVVENHQGKGIFICISSAVFDELVKNMRNMLSLFFYIKENPCAELPADDVEWIKAYHKQIFKELQETNNIFRSETANALLLAMLYKVCNLYGHKLIMKGNHQEEIFEKFLRLVSVHYKKHREVAWYAEQMYMTPKYMSTVVKQVSGRTALDWIQSYVLQEAKLMLLRTDKSIQQIAYELHFSSQSFFGKWFKSRTSLSPSDFRVQ